MYEQECAAKGAGEKICSRSSAAIQRDERLCAIRRDRADHPFALANSSSAAKPIARFRYLTVMRSRALVDIAGKSVFAVPLVELFAGDCCRVRRKLEAEEFAEVFAWWPAPISSPGAAGNLRGRFVRWFSRIGRLCPGKSLRPEARGDCNASKKQPVLFVDADILWFRDPASLLGDPALWEKPRALRENNCHQRREIAVRHCPQVLEPPFVNSGIVALHGELMAPELLRSIVRDALSDPQDSR